MLIYHDACLDEGDEIEVRWSPGVGGSAGQLVVSLVARDSGRWYANTRFFNRAQARAVAHEMLRALDETEPRQPTADQRSAS